MELTDRTTNTAGFIDIAEDVIAGKSLPQSLALQLLSLPEERAYDLMYAAHLVKRHFLGDKALHRCSIVNAKSGGCSEDCSFCAQSVRYATESQAYPLLSAEKIVKAAEYALNHGSTNFGIVTAMRALPKGKLLDQVCDAIREIRKRGDILPDASLGILGREELLQLKEAGLEIYHHNLECAESYYPSITTTRNWQDNWNTLEQARDIGLKICAGGILGMGEELGQRAEFFTQLQTLNPNKIPLNFLVAVEGTPLADAKKLKPLECLMSIAVLRLMVPQADIFVAGGRIQHLRQLQSMIFFAGATGMMVGNYLTTPGRTKENDLELLRDLELIDQAEYDRLLKPLEPQTASTLSC